MLLSQSLPVPACPTNGKVGKAVDTLILKALLARPLTELAANDYRFCRAPDCPTVYYSADGLQTFAENDLRERVFQKHPDDDDAPVCYCFGHTVGSIRAELRETGHSTVAARIDDAIRTGLCACDIRNPQGDCCLGNVRALVRRLETESGSP
jgi:hypothetical protein